MKTMNQLVGTLMAGSVLALCLISNLQAAQPAPRALLYLSAKDPDLPGLPFNPHPELPILEVERGVYIVDDTAIPDTPEQVASRQRRRAAAEWAARIASDPAAVRVAEEARRIVQEAAWRRNLEAVRPWLHTDLRKPDGSPAALADTRAAEATQITQLAQVLQAKAQIDRSAVAEYLAAHNLPSARFELPDGRIAMIVAIENRLYS